MERRENRGRYFFGDLLPEEYFTEEAIEGRRDEMKRIQQVTETVHSILENHPETRNNDNWLFIKVIESINSELLHMPIEDVLRNSKYYGIPHFESVRRARQKLQAMHPELRASEAVQDARAENEQVVRDYAADCPWG